MKQHPMKVYVEIAMACFLFLKYFEYHFPPKRSYYALFAINLDFHASSAGITEGFSMCGGDFVEVYNDPSQVGKQICMS